MIVEENHSIGLKCYYDTDDPKHFYGRIFGGIGWRGKQPGFIVAVGENLEKDKNLDVYHRFILKEYENFDTLKLLNMALDFRDNSRVKPWVGDPDNEVEMMALEKVNEKLPHEFYLSIDWAPHSDDPKAFEFYLGMIERGVNPYKVLHFGKSKITKDLQEINLGNRNSLSVGDYPAVTALGSVLAYMDSHGVDVNQGIDGGGSDDGAYDYDYLRGKKI